jgi:tRNA threonylcarbamoyladenosine dehydratase
MNDDEQRFGGLARLYGAGGLQRLVQASVCVVGIGGVGSWAAESLARSGVGNITLVDLDDICLSNVNRQLHAVDGAIGRPKVEVMAERIHAIHPSCRVRAVAAFFTEGTADEILEPRFDFVLDAIDQAANKSLLIARCRQKEIPIVAVGGAGGRRTRRPLRWPTWRKRRTTLCCARCDRNCAKSMALRAIPKCRLACLAFFPPSRLWRRTKLPPGA